MVIYPHPSLFLSPDHCFIQCSLAIPSTAVTVNKLSFRKWRESNLEVFKGNILASELKELPVTDLATTYDRTLRSILDKHAPAQSKMPVVRPRVPWFDEQLKRLKTKRRKLERKINKTNLDSDIRAYREACAEYCSRLMEEILCQTYT